MATTKQKFVIVGSGLIVAGISSAVTYFATRKLLEAEYEEQLKKEIQDSIDFLVETQIMPNQVKVVSEQEFDEIEKEPEEIIPEPIEPVEGVRVFPEEDKPTLEQLAKNQMTQYNTVMATEPVEEVLPEEPAYSDPDISVISKDIFLENGSEYEQSSISYFLGDNGVLDEIGYRVDEATTLIGSQVPPFGEMSGDPQIVYLRNKKLERDFEIISDPGRAADYANPQDDAATLQHSLQELQAKYDPNRRR